LHLKNNEIINVQIISKSKKLEVEREIDVAGISGKVIPRENNYITIYIEKKMPTTLPRIIKITPELLELIYLIHGDGHYQDKFYFVNKAPELHEFVLEYFEDIFRIPRRFWRARVLISDLNFKESSKKYWMNRLSLEESQFYNASKPGFNTDKFGNLRIIIDKTIVSVIFKFIFNQIRLNKERSLHSLNGLLCAEGGAQIYRVGLHRITLSFNKKEKDMFQRIMDNLNLKYIIENDQFIIQGWDNQYLFFKTFFSQNVIPFRLHNQRRENAIIGFLNHSFTKTMKKYLSVLQQKNNVSLKEFSKILKIRQDSILNTTRKNQYVKMSRIDGKGIRGDPLMISISDEGKNFLDIIHRMEVEL
jgi:hypothetical protein